MKLQHILAAGAALVVVACASSSSPLRMTRDARISIISEAACARYGETSDGCPGYGTASGQKYQTKYDCQRDFANVAGHLWPADKCGEGRINPDRYVLCENSVETQVCSAGAVTFFERTAALDVCQASRLCIDPP